MAATATMSGPRYAPEDPTLPKPWRSLVDGNTGYLYFWNPETNVTQYERPTVSLSNPDVYTVHVQEPPIKQTHGDSSDDRYNRGSKSEYGHSGCEVPCVICQLFCS